jgi:hypothetical protein
MSSSNQSCSIALRASRQANTSSVALPDCFATVELGKEVTLFSRHEKVLSKRFPGVATALASFEGDFLDGELVALDSHRRPSFQ